MFFKKRSPLRKFIPTLKGWAFFSSFCNYTIPAGARSWNISIESGNAYFNGVGPVLAGNSLNGGGYAGYKTLNNLNIGITGGRAMIIYEV